MNKFFRIAAAGLSFAVAAPVLAQPAETPVAEPAMGTQTRAWMDLQVSNNAAMGAARPMPGEIADQVYSRYVKSFSHAIPETFDRESFVEGGGGSR